MTNFNQCRSSLNRILAILTMVAIVITLFPSSAMAAGKRSVDSIESIHISENNYSESMREVEAFLDTMLQTGYITGEKNVSLYYEKYVVPNANGTIVISHGFTENLEKYNEMIYYFVNMGYSVYAMEHRGHSRSGRLGIDEYQVHVEKFDYYVSDLKKFLDKVVVPEASKDNLYLFAHSMGGGVGVQFLEQHTGYFDAAILNAPMLEVNSGTIPSWLAKALSIGASYTKYATQYVLGQGPYDENAKVDLSASSSFNRCEYIWGSRINNKELRMGGASYNWASECYKATFKITLPCQAKKVKIPVLLFQAGNDAYVKAGGQNKFAKYAKDCTIVRFDNAKHEIFLETDDIQVQFLNRVFDFLAVQ